MAADDCHRAHNFPPDFFDINYNIILKSVPGFINGAFPFIFPFSDKNSERIIYLSQTKVNIQVLLKFIGLGI